ncbi:MAG TPA: chorismate mutase [Alphaproteobacteria bacterium]|jgi:isochorismate pyruvate lyase
MSDIIKAPDACADMAEVRAEIDRLDRLIVARLAERSGYVARAAEIKRTRAEVVDKPRIEDVIKKVRGQAASFGADPELLEAIYRSMVAAFIAFEERTFDRKGRN